MNELIHLRQDEQKLRPIIKLKTYNRGLFEIYKTGFLFNERCITDDNNYNIVFPSHL